MAHLFCCPILFGVPILLHLLISKLLNIWHFWESKYSLVIFVSSRLDITYFECISILRNLCHNINRSNDIIFAVYYSLYNTHDGNRLATRSCRWGNENQFLAACYTPGFFRKCGLCGTKLLEDGTVYKYVWDIDFITTTVRTRDE